MLVYYGVCVHFDLCAGVLEMHLTVYGGFVYDGDRVYGDNVGLLVLMMIYKQFTTNIVCLVFVVL